MIFKETALRPILSSSRNVRPCTTTTIGLLNVMGTEGVCSHRGRGHHQLHKIHSIQSALECFSKQYDVFTSLVHSEVSSCRLWVNLSIF